MGGRNACRMKSPNRLAPPESGGFLLCGRDGGARRRRQCSALDNV